MKKPSRRDLLDYSPVMERLEAQLAAVSAALAALNHFERTKKLTDHLNSFEEGPVAPVLNPQITGEGSIKSVVDQALKILGIDKNASARWRVDDAEDVQAEVLARVRKRLDDIPLRVLFQLGWNGLRKTAAQELANVLDKREAKQRGGTGGRKARKTKTNIQAASHILLQNLDNPEAPDIPAPAAFILASASKLGPRATRFFKAIDAGADQKSAAKEAEISTRMARKYLQQMRALLKTES